MAGHEHRFATYRSGSDAPVSRCQGCFKLESEVKKPKPARQEEAPRVAFSEAPHTAADE